MRTVAHYFGAAADQSASSRAEAIPTAPARIEAKGKRHKSMGVALALLRSSSSSSPRAKSRSLTPQKARGFGMTAAGKGTPGQEVNRASCTVKTNGVCWVPSYFFMRGPSRTSAIPPTNNAIETAAGICAVFSSSTVALMGPNFATSSCW